MSSIPELLKKAYQSNEWHYVAKAYKMLTGEEIYKNSDHSVLVKLTKPDMLPAKSGAGYKKGRLSKVDKERITQIFDDSPSCIEEIAEEMNRKPETIAKFIKDNKLKPQLIQEPVDLTQPISPQLENNNGIVGTRDNSDHNPETDGQSRKTPYEKKDRIKLNKFSDKKNIQTPTNEGWLFSKTPDYIPSERKPETNIINARCIVCGKQEEIFISSLIPHVGEDDTQLYKCNNCTCKPTPQTV